MQAIVEKQAKTEAEWSGLVDACMSVCLFTDGTILLAESKRCIACVAENRSERMQVKVK